MAKNTRGSAANAESQYNELDSAASLWRKLNDAKEKGLQYDETALNNLKKQYGSLSNLEKKIEKIFDTWGKLTDTIEDSNLQIQETLENYDDLEDTITSIGSKLGKQTGLYAATQKKLDGTKAIVESISARLQNQNDLSDKQVSHIVTATNSYKNFQTSIATAQQNLHEGNMTQAEFNQLVMDSYKEFDTLIARIDDSTESGRELKETLLAARTELESFNKAAEKSEQSLSGMNAVLSEMGSSGIPMARELSDAIGDIANKGSLGRAALIALGAAAGKLAYDYFGAPIQASIEASNDVKENQIEGAKRVAQAQNDLAFAAKQASLDFGYQLQEMAAQFNAASKTALFGKGLGSVGYAASQLQLAGISAETIASATVAASKAGSGSSKLAADMAIFAERSGISVDNVSDIQQAFKLLDKVSAKTALNMAEGTRAMAEQAGLNIGDVMNEVASASQMALEAQVKSGKALARQVVYAKSLGVSFQEVAKAGQNMVLNYKDSIKSEMSLSAMLGKNVNLSEVRAKFMAGDQEGALKALQAQGLKPSDMNMFQQQALSQALGGMDLNTLEKVGTPGYQEGVGKVGTLEEKSTKASNDAFLALKQSAESALNTQQAMIAGQKAVEQAALDTMKENAWLNSQAYVEYKAAIKQLSMERGLTENIGGAISSAVGGVLGNFVGGKGMGNMFKGIGNMFKGGGGAAGMGKGLLKVGKGLLGKVALPLTAAMSIYDGFQGFNADKKASTGDKFKNAGSSIVNGLTFGLLGKDASQIKAEAEAKKKSPEVIKKEAKPTTDAVKESTKATEAVKKAQDVAIKEVQYTGKVQNEMVALLATNAQLLEEIMNNTAGERAINLSGKKVNSTLLNQNRKTYAIARG